ncbi:inorganic phosphate transporter [Caldivirga maquilingensis]|uniref:Phosphate/sulphate permease-like protein n=1 Tax=Caldivirga maquilingensis (strain ATCC 700844 / DSM 13496 / JCM 10307 / IC-167) TaxID=397948 RepID=A8MBZ8_CALMQ|nr:inorganic phosphate transporter [Caldivirga maquilingensis]ABW02782.1 Phosphate/sulphate permease-like protein [Caldivirga maquilingensis IC-167]
MIIEAALALILALTFLVSSNNLSLVAGMAVGSRLLRPGVAMMIALTGYVIGLLAQGSEMKGYSVAPEGLLILSLIGVLVFTIGEVAKIPMSITNSLYMSWSALVLYNGGSLPVNFPIVLSSWFIIPILLALAAYLLYPSLVRLTASSNPIRRLSLYRLVMILTVFLVGFSFGANNLGLVWSMLGFSRIGLIGVIFASTLGVIITGRRTLGQFSRGMFTPPPVSSSVTQLLSFTALELSTVFAIPISLTLCTVGSLLGISMARGMRIINTQYLRLVLIGYVSTMIIAFTGALLIVKLI